LFGPTDCFCCSVVRHHPAQVRHDGCCRRRCRCCCCSRRYSSFSCEPWCRCCSCRIWRWHNCGSGIRGDGSGGIAFDYCRFRLLLRSFRTTFRGFFLHLGLFNFGCIVVLSSRCGLLSAIVHLFRDRRRRSSRLKDNRSRRLVLIRRSIASVNLCHGNKSEQRGQRYKWLRSQLLLQEDGGVEERAHKWCVHFETSSASSSPEVGTFLLRWTRALIKLNQAPTRERGSINVRNELVFHL